jgi:hypothetical protein
MIINTGPSNIFGESGTHLFEKRDAGITSLRSSPILLVWLIMPGANCISCGGLIMKTAFRQNISKM